MDKFSKGFNKKDQVEIVGSGYSQIIGPLVPYEVNIKNHQIGLNEYNKILGITPKTVLVKMRWFFLMTWPKFIKKSDTTI